MGYERRGTGKTVTKKGYVRITSNPNRHQYEHRLVTRMLYDASHPLTKSVLPPFKDLTVHHFDGKRDHNCIKNLTILDPAIHAAIARIAEMPDWVCSEEMD